MNLTQKIACKALIVNDQNEVLLLRKGQDDIRHSGKSGWHNLPGGKLEPGETIQEGLNREIQEETGIMLHNIPQVPIFVGEWRPVVKDTSFQIIGMFFLCKDWTGQLILSEEHDSHTWISSNTLGSYAILPPEDNAIKIGFSLLAME